MAKGPRTALIITVAGFFTAAYSLLLLRWGSLDPNTGSEPLGRTVSVLFWLGLLLGAGAELYFCRETARVARRDTGEHGKWYAGAARGFFRVASAPEALAADILCALALLLEGLTLLGALRPGTLWEYAFIASFLFGLAMHGLLNGKNYLYQRRLVSARERKRQA